MSKSNQDATFKYTVKAADQFISAGSYREGLLYSKSAYEAAKSVSELQELLNVMRVVLRDINPNLMNKMRITMTSNNKSINKYREGFHTLKRAIKVKLEKLELSGEQESVLPWHASYTFEQLRTTKAASSYFSSHSYFQTNRGDKAGDRNTCLMS
jgi:soluble cytochrome b562